MENRLMAPPIAATSAATASSQLTHNPTLVPQFQHCIEACLLCFESCEQLVVHLGAQEEVDSNLIRLLNDAIEITQVSATFMLRGSSFHIRTCAVCAEVCKVCAETCEQSLRSLDNSNDDDFVKTALAALKDCAESCYQMAHHH